MNKKLFICEKPGQARDISRVLRVNHKKEHYFEGPDIIVTWCLGHLLEAAKPDHYTKDLKPWRVSKLPVIPEQWHMLPVAKVKKQLLAVKKLIKETNHIIISTDADREGELIAREVMSFCKYAGKIERLWLSALDDTSIKRALQTIKPGSATQALYLAGLGRQRADWMVGMNMTMATSCLFGKYGEGVLSVGRVQTPTLQLIIDRDCAIEKFTSCAYYELFAKFMDDKQIAVWLKWCVPASLQGDEQGRCVDKAAVSKIASKINNQPAIVTKLSTKEKKQVPPLPFSLSALQKKASALYGFTAKKTLSIAQELYEKYKATSYPRTDSGYLPQTQHSEAQDVLDALLQGDNSLSPLIKACDVTLKSPAWNDKKVTAHHGIIPTSNKAVKLLSMAEDVRKIYHLIRIVYLTQFLGDFIYKQTSLVVVCMQEEFSATGNVPLILGWKQALDKDKWGSEQKSKDETSQELPAWAKGQELIEQQEKVLDKKTKPPAHFTEGTLIGAMESVGRYVDCPKLKKVLKETSGIGTQATRAAIIETLMKRDYIERKKKKILATNRGRALIDLLPKEVKDPATTARWEQDLDEVALGKLQLDSFLSKQKTNVLAMIEALKNNNATRIFTDKENNISPSKYLCPSCNKTMSRKKVNGKKRFFWGCSGYPDCKVTLAESKGRPVKKNQIAPKVTDKPCPACTTGRLVERQGKYGKFFGCSNYPKCKQLIK